LEECRHLTEELGVTDRVLFHGKFPLNEMKRFYKMADCFLLTLRGGDFIGMTLPGKTQGYMGVGKPIVAAIDGAAAQTIREADCGECVSAGDVQGLSENMIKIMENFDLYKEKGRNGRRYFEEHFTRGIFMRSLNDLLESSAG
jgi:glycosyltransferase involved in cell wall biosynthesis